MIEVSKTKCLRSDTCRGWRAAGAKSVMKGVKNDAAKTQSSQKFERDIKNKVPRRHLQGVASRRSQKCDRCVRNEAAKRPRSKKCERDVKIKGEGPATRISSVLAAKRLRSKKMT